MGMLFTVVVYRVLQNLAAYIRNGLFFNNQSKSVSNEPSKKEDSQLNKDKNDNSKDPPVDSSSSSRISLLQNVHKENVNASTGQSTFDATIFNKNADDDSIETLDDVNSIETPGNDTVVDSKKLEEVLKVDKSSGQNLETPESNLPGTVDENLSENSSSTSDDSSDNIAELFGKSPSLTPESSDESEISTSAENESSDSSTPEEDLDETKQELEDTNENLFIYPKFYIDELYQKRDKNKFEERLNCRDEPKKEVTFTDISRFKLIANGANHCKYVALTGDAGSGKTKTCERVVLSNAKSKIQTVFIQFAFLDEKVSLNELLTRFKLFDEQFVEENTDWIENKGKNLTIVLDGLYQATFEISDKRMLKNFDVNKKYDPSILISLILNRKLLRKANLLLSCTPEALSELPISSYPEVVVSLSGFEKGDALKIIKSSTSELTQNEEMRIENVIDNDRVASKLLSNALCLNMFCSIMNKHKLDVALKCLSSKASLFAEFVKVSINVDGDIFVDEKFENLASLAFDKTIDGTLIVEEKDFDRFYISITEIGSLIVKNSCDKLKNQHKFTSKSMQDFLASMSAWMSTGFKFESFVDLLMPKTHLKVDGNSFECDPDEIGGARTFAISCLNLLDTSKETIKKNVDVFLQKLTEHIINFHRDNLTLDLPHTVQLRKDLNEVTNEEVIKRIKHMFQNHLFTIYIDNSNTLDEDKTFIKSYVTQTNCLKVRTSYFSEKDWTSLLQILISDVEKFEEVNIHGVTLLNEEIIASILSCVLKVKNSFYMCFSKEVKDDDVRKWSLIMQEKITQLDTTKLNNDEVSVALEQLEYKGSYKIILKTQLRKDNVSLFSYRL